jgi:hypothetical protein
LKRCLDFIERLYGSHTGWEYIDSDGAHIFRKGERYLGIPKRDDDLEAEGVCGEGGV